VKHKLIWVVLSLALVLPAFLCGCESKEDNDAATYLKLGIAEHKTERYREAIAEFEKAIAIKPAYADAYWCMGESYKELKQYPDAIAAYQKYVALNPTGKNSDDARKAINELPETSRRDKEAEAYRTLGFRKSLAGSHRDAIVAYKKSIALNPEDADVYYSMGNSYKKLKQYSEALAAYKQCVALKPTGKTADLARERLSEMNGL
jgi:tetratricopeptide (TPR) repeat protein